MKFVHSSSEIFIMNKICLNDTRNFKYEDDIWPIMLNHLDPKKNL